jgi:hypothetical protein
LPISTGTVCQARGNHTLHLHISTASGGYRNQAWSSVGYLHTLSTFTALPIGTDDDVVMMTHQARGSSGPTYYASGCQSRTSPPPTRLVFKAPTKPTGGQARMEPFFFGHEEKCLDAWSCSNDMSNPALEKPQQARYTRPTPQGQFRRGRSRACKQGSLQEGPHG